MFEYLMRMLQKYLLPKRVYYQQKKQMEMQMMQMQMNAQMQQAQIRAAATGQGKDDKRPNASAPENAGQEAAQSAAGQQTQRMQGAS